MQTTGIAPGYSIPKTTSIPITRISSQPQVRPSLSNSLKNRERKRSPPRHVCAVSSYRFVFGGSVVFVPPVPGDLLLGKHFSFSL